MINKLNKKILANALRFLSVDAVQLANSGHPGMPLGMADIAEVLWNDFLVHNPNNPVWFNRDRFILSNGHGSMLLYALLHLTGYQLTIQDLKKFRQLHSKTPGHPEYAITPGVEATTGPLGQGLAMAVGMALAEHLLAKTFNQPNFNIIDHYTYCFIGDGCLMEGISHEVCSLAGTLGLSKLIVMWDNNKISIDGNTAQWFTDDTAARFKAYNWHVIDNIDGHDADSIYQAIKTAKSQNNKPSLICCNTTLAYGCPNLANNAKAHGAPLGESEITDLRAKLNWQYEPFFIPEEIYHAWDYKTKGQELNNSWDQLLINYSNQYPELYNQLTRRRNGQLPNNFNDLINNLLNHANNQPNNIATRQASLLVLNAISDSCPELLGGSADLSHSNLTFHQHAKPLVNYIYYGVREFGMFAIMNGIALHQGFIPYGGTFLVFADYGKNAIRLSALMQQKVIYILTHDSIGLGEDGPTHQPIEQLTMLRTIPNVSVWRPADLTETIIAWQQALQYQGPSCLALSRQKLPDLTQYRNKININNIKKGGYILYESPNSNNNIEAIIIATGSEVSLALEAAKELINSINIRVVSIPNLSIFLQQDISYQEFILPKNIKSKIVVEAGSSGLWYKLIGSHGKVIGIDQFGLSGSSQDIYQEFNITIAAIKQALLM